MLSPRFTVCPHPRLRPLVLALSAALCAPAYVAAAADTLDAPDAPVAVVTITGSNGDAAPRVASAAKLDLTVRETPQSVSLISRERMDDFRLDNVNDVLATTTGVSVERVETDRTYFTARGFDIINFQYDGIGAPLVFGNVNGDLDTALYERIEVVRGANGLSSGTGNPSATVNFVRKRPLSGTQAQAALTLGSWDQRRLQGDVSAALNESGTLRGRAVAVAHETESWLDRYRLKKNIGYAVLEARLSDATVLTVGHLRQENRTRGGLWGALPLAYEDGSPTGYDVSTSTSANWSRWDTTISNTFADLSHRINADWSLRAALSHTDTSSASKLQYVYGSPVRGADATGLKLYSYPSMYQAEHRQSLADLSASGKFDLGGRRHDLMLGVAWSRSRLDDLSLYGQGIGTELTLDTAFGGSYPEPSFDARTDGSSYHERRKSAYLAARWNLSERLKLLTGANHTSSDAGGLSYGSSKATTASKTTPYVGLVYEATPSISTYASYTGIFNPQSEADASGHALAPVEGSNAELGFKADLAGKRLALSGALFRARQQNLAEQEGFEAGRTIYRGIEAESTGAELELSGELAKGWHATLGITKLSIDNGAGVTVRTYVPRRLVKMASTWRPAALPQWKFGATLNWQDDTHRDEGKGLILRQGSYALLGLMAQWAINDKLDLSINVNNAADRKHLTSLYWSQAYYGAPRNASATLNWKY